MLEGSMRQQVLDFLDVLKGLGRPKNEISDVQKKVKDFSKKLYRYRSLRPLRKDDLDNRLSEIGGKILMSPSSLLNDPFDTIQLYNTDDYNSMLHTFMKNQDYVKYQHEKLKSSGLTKREIQYFFTSDKPFDFLFSRNTHINYMPPFFQSIYQAEIYDFFPKMNRYNDSILRIACFTETYDNMPMWSSYASDYTGICLEYDIRDEYICKDIFPITYTDSIPNMLEYSAKYQRIENFREEVPPLFPREQISALRLFKTPDWSYEREWRYLYDCTEEWMEQMYASCPEFASIIDEASIASGSTTEITITEEVAESISAFCLENLMSLPQPERIHIDYKPCRVYLGHKITDSDEREIRILADSLGIEVFKMKVTPLGYKPLTTKEVDAEKARKLVKEAEELRENYFDEVICKCTKALELSPVAEAYRLRGDCYRVERSNPRRALEDYRKALDIDPYDMLSRTKAGLAYSDLYKSTLEDEYYSLAVRELSFCVKHFSMDKSYMALTDVHIAAGKYDLAIGAIRKGLKRNKDSADVIRKYTEVPGFVETLHKHPLFLELIKDESDLAFLLDV